jgi:iron complex outermembrane receptor protein
MHNVHSSCRRALSPLAAAAILACATTVLAQPVTLPRVTVQASPVIEGNDVDRFGAMATTVTRQQISDLHAVDLASALRRTPGVTISRFNPVGSFGGDEGGAVYVRGLGASRPGSEIKTLVDGVPFYMATWNHPLLDLLPINGMAAIRVLKGPQPQHFGNAFAAVELTPKRAGPRDGVTGDVQVAAGRHGTLVQQFDLAGRSGDWDYMLAQGHAESDGHRESASGRLDNVMGQLGYRFNAQWSANVLALDTNNRARDPGHATTGAGRGDAFNTRGSLLALTVEHQHGTAKGQLKLYSTRGRSEQQPGLVTDFSTSGLRWREVVTPWRGGELVAGLDTESVTGDVSPIGFTGPKLRWTSPYLAVHHTLELTNGWRVTPSAGVRLDRHSQYGNGQTPHAGLVLRAGEQLALRANVSRGRSAPGLDAALLAHLIPALGTSWRNLAAEKMAHQEVGMSWTPSRDTTVDLLLFSDRLTNRYVFAFPPAVAAPGFINLGNYRVRGSELTVQQALAGGWSLYGGLTSLKATRTDLPYAPASSLSLGANWQQGAWRASADVQRQSSMQVLNAARAADATNLASVSGFTVANARLAYRLPVLGERGEIFAAAENLFNRSYEFRPGYPMPGRALQLGVHASF